MENLLNPVLFFQFFGSTCTICLILFYLALVRELRYIMYVCIALHRPTCIDIRCKNWCQGNELINIALVCIQHHGGLVFSEV
jgi:hypothetical protein